MNKKLSNLLFTHPYLSTFIIGSFLILISLVVKYLRPYSGISANLFTEAIGIITGIILIGIIFEKHNIEKEKLEEKKK